MGPEDKPYISGAAIVFTFIVFFPVGIILMIMRSVKHRHYTHLRILDKSLFGKMLLILFLFLSISYFVQLAQGGHPLLGVYIFCILFLLLPGMLFLIQSALLKKKLLARFEKYRSLIYEQGATAIPQLAAAVQKNVTVVANELLRMAYLGMLPDAYVSLPANRVVLRGVETSTNVYSFSVNITGGDWEAAPTTEYVESKPKEDPPMPKTIDCFGCGAKTQMRPGESKECDYCGSVIHYS